MFDWQKPLDRDPVEVRHIIGTIDSEEPSRDLNIVWCWGIDKDHAMGIHQYDWAMDLFVNKLLPQVPRVTAQQTMHFPTQAQWDSADLVVFYQGMDRHWGENEYAQIDAFQARGGGLMFLHLALLQADGAALAERIGLAFGFGDAPNGGTKYGVLPTPVTLTDAATESPIFAGFPRELEMVDELYWNLRGDPASVTTLVTSQAGPEFATPAPPQPEDLDGNEWPVMWTREVGDGRVFATVGGHNYFSFNDPHFRIILLRAMAWAMHEDADPYMKLISLEAAVR
ncbi:MAG: ThuA domain-containing protein [Gammaproteobacteria bacterium]|nr:ThuA domain-containing protein [Gammaproteobacteria bacterium]